MVPAATGAPAAAAASADDVRTLPVRYNSAGARHRDFKECVELQSEDTWPDWPIRGPRTCGWCLRFMAENAGTPRGWHQKWKTECKLTNTDGGVPLHEVCCEMLEALTVYDQVNVVNLAGAEHAARQLQLLEERWRDRVASSAEAQEVMQDMHLYSGRITRGNLCICPTLQEWAPSELSKEYSVAKECRKAREECALARPKQPGK